MPRGASGGRSSRALALLVWLFRRQLREPQSRARIDRFALHLPLLGGLLVKIDTARLARTLGTLLGNGVPLLNALAIARETLANAVLREALSETATAVKEGRGLAEPLGRAGPFPPLAIHLLAVGERSGHLDAMLLKIAEIFDRETRGTIERLMTLLVPGADHHARRADRGDHRRGAGGDPLGLPAAFMSRRR